MSSQQLSLPCPGEIELLVDIDYQPYEEPDRGPEARYPGCAESFEIEHITLNGHNITTMLTDAQIAAIALRVQERLDEPQFAEPPDPPSYDLFSLFDDVPF